MSKHLSFDFPKSTSEALDRVVAAYGFSMKMQLAEHLGIAASSLSARYKRDVFPADIVLQCALETGTSIEWLVTGRGGNSQDIKSDTLSLIRKRLINGQLYEADKVLFDKGIFLEPNHAPTSPMCLIDGNIQYIVDEKYSEVHDGLWLVEIEGKIGIRTLTRIPVKKVRISGTGAAFDCDLDDITVLGRVVLTVE
ncbi:Bacteriophage CI repressor helix-turn-helix domain [Serratia quinivorans]|uniref:phage repressor protein CI n=1 Tax=Serratia TaxID=613 RepID=UPI0004778A04|nr:MULTISPECIES: phage repressor protein CI [Serratia]CAI1058618.1 Bacteriophage CI repressor helix-turn-helix domain [Serratia quinivorans]CAI1074047.1 Bacteriophage CI repressor helix-turn-helix domain [Serratia quinivorans]CAI1876859.1 Bacteriophage CI repressor helix-turn-helix domain [Serratia quinivorans]CAI2123280.1 Bacteriophage CI repressor helix-turn-helix domain [Serratia quinivorans]CAI2489891.1 Bacteriophage CI repressor helix-turn-helix domain [Serratia quinivorans]